MEPATNAPAVFDREFLPLRARLIELAAALDRVDRARAGDDPRMAQIRQSLEILLSEQSGRAEQVQIAFSLPYDPDWQTKFAMETK